MTRAILATIGFWLANAACLAADKTAEVEAERAKFQGTWQLVSAETDGKTTPEDAVAKIRVVISGNKHSVYLGDKLLAHDVGFEIDPSVSPKATTDTINDGPDKGKEIRGIYRLEGEALTSCVGPVGGPRPVEFTAKAGSGQTLRVFRRVKGGGTKEKAIEAELRRFGGTWRFVSMEIDGKVVPEANFAGSSLHFEGDRFTTPGAEKERGTYVIDPTVTPKTIDVILGEGTGRRTTIPGIYELDGDTYKICSARPGKPRPKDFSARAGSGQGLTIMKREKP